jgi:hypothetical protein
VYVVYNTAHFDMQYIFYMKKTRKLLFFIPFLISLQSHSLGGYGSQNYYVEAYTPKDISVKSGYKIPKSHIEEIKYIKNLFDDGIITKGEFDKLKQEIMNKL